MDMKECVTKHYTLRMALATIRATPAVVLGMRQRLSSLRLWMKKRLEKSRPYWVYEKISLWVASPLILFTLTQYAYIAIAKPFKDFLEICLPILGVTLALPALCGQIAGVTSKEEEEEEAFHRTLAFAAEKFLHSSLLFIQSLIVMFVRSILLGLHWSPSLNLLKDVITNLGGGIAAVAAVYGAWAWYWGFSALNSTLWSRAHPRKP